jgi:hypothetical protein
MMEYAASVGAASLSVTTSTQEPASTVAPSSSSGASSLLIVAAVGATLGAVAIVGVGVALLFARRKPVLPVDVSKSRTVVIVQDAAATSTTVTNPMADRVGFEPMHRTRV